MLRLGRFRAIAAAFAVMAAIVLIASQVDARPGGGGGMGSRGSRTFSAPPATRTAPNTASPIERSMTNPSAARPATTGAATTGGFFNRPGFMGSMFAGFLGAGLFGMLFGHGLFGGLGGFASILGLLLQVGLVVIVARLAWTWWQRRNGGYAMAGGPVLRQAQTPGQDSGPNASLNAGPQSSGGFGFTPASEPVVTLEKSDYDAFETLLNDVQVAYGKEDLARLRTLVTPEVLSFMSDDLAKNASRGVVNEMSGIKLLQGDLSEAWQEDDSEYATVAMKYELTDVTIDRASKNVVDGSPDPQEVTELWTFMRVNGGHWILSAIQQT